MFDIFSKCLKKIQVEIRLMLTPLLYRHKHENMTTSQIYTLLSFLKETFSIKGSILETGCYRCQTSYLLFNFLKENGINKDFYAIDRFSDFNLEAIDDDINKHG